MRSLDLKKVIGRNFIEANVWLLQVPRQFIFSKKLHYYWICRS